MISHIKNKKPNIVDISKKKPTNRFAKASGLVKFSNNSFTKIKSLNTKKGEIENIAIIAGILGAKKTSELIPLCHNIKIDKIDLKIETLDKIFALKITATVKAQEKTGVEMEALTSVTIACLTIYDMCKSIDKKIIISDIKLEEKKGGKSDFINQK
tara:strand:- start:126 stop:593 length:468 start_codon:yes stop_codon:yes gene_type:complete